jgi:Mn2+/Fe2+ NRAMP family transporter
MAILNRDRRVMGEHAAGDLSNALSWLLVSTLSVLSLYMVIKAF